MIKGLMGDAYINVAGGNTSVPFVNMNINNPMQGMLRVYGNDIQVFDGNTWTNLNSSYASLTLTPTYQIALDWAKKKMQEEMEWETMAVSNKAVAIALENLNIAKAQLKTTALLSREHESTS